MNAFTSFQTKLGFPRWYIMALVIPPGFGSAAFVFTGQPGTQPYVTTIGVDLSEAGGDFVEAANNIMLSYQQGFTNQWSAQLVLDHVTLSVGQDGPGGSVDSNLAPITSTRTGAFPPTAMSAILRKATNVLGRPGRGRMFIPGIVSENEVDEDGSIVNARRAAIDLLAQDFLTGLTAGGNLQTFNTPPVLLHSARVPPIPPTPISRFAVSDTVGWIRGRIR